MKSEKTMAQNLVSLLDQFIANPDPHQVITDLGWLEKDEDRFTMRGPIHASVVELEESEKARREKSGRTVKHRKLPVGGNKPWVDLLFSCRQKLGCEHALELRRSGYGIVRDDPVKCASIFREWVINHYL